MHHRAPTPNYSPYCDRPMHYSCAAAASYNSIDPIIDGVGGAMAPRETVNVANDLDICSISPKK